MCMLNSLTGSTKNRAPIRKTSAELFFKKIHGIKNEFTNSRKDSETTRSNPDVSESNAVRQIEPSNSRSDDLEVNTRYGSKSSSILGCEIGDERCERGFWKTKWQNCLCNLGTEIGSELSGEDSII